MVGFFADYIEIHVVNSVRTFPELIHRYGDAVRNFLIVADENFFAHYFRDHKLFGLVGHGFGVENVFALLQIAENDR